ncbi:MAG: SGNH/GDSL hydrolase family protein [Solirubrobacterales bacterium]
MTVQDRLSARFVALAFALALLLGLALSGVLTASASAATAANYVALGDSYSSGEGTGYSTYNLDVGCRRSTYGYPQLVANQRGNTNLKFVACSGAKTSDVKNNQLSALGSSTTFATMTIGGNDIGFGDLITACTLRNCSSDINTANDKINGVLPGNLSSLYAAMKAKAPQAKFIILSYPRVLGSSGCFATTGVSADERSRLGTLEDNLNSKIKAAATAAGFTYVNSDSRFSGHNVCASSEWINGLNILHPEESYHPNRAGTADGFTPLVRAIVG